MAIGLVLALGGLAACAKETPVAAEVVVEAPAMVVVEEEVEVMLDADGNVVGAMEDAVACGEDAVDGEVCEEVEVMVE